MGQLIKTAGATCSTRPLAVAPLVVAVSLAVAAGTGATAADLYAPATGTPAAYNGTVMRDNSCEAVKLVVTYLTGEDCDACTVDTLSTVTQTYTIPAGAQGIELDPGYISKITAQVVDGTGTGINSVSGMKLDFTSGRAGACAGQDVLVP
jgi:hypothetical protein